jgi:3-phenylpropionate/trans-cinnamate dioxygenase ferredoxin reductase component
VLPEPSHAERQGRFRLFYGTDSATTHHQRMVHPRQGGQAVPHAYRYIIVGAGLTGAHAVEGIREVDTEGTILLIGHEEQLPYERPPLSKKLWFGQKQLPEIFVHDQAYYESQGVTLTLGERVAGLDARQRLVVDGEGKACAYDKLLLATGGAPRKLDIAGGDLEGVYYYRYLDDYLALRAQAAPGTSAVVIGGGFIGSEMAAALSVNRVEVTMLFRGKYLVPHVFPESLGLALVQQYTDRGVRVLADDVPASIQRKGERFVVETRAGTRLEADIIVAGVGMAPAVGLAERAGADVGDGILVNEYLQTSHDDVYAAGDNAFFPYQALGTSMRIEHWDHAVNQGKQAGRNMAGANEPYTYMPYFFSDLFDFGYEAVGAVDTRLEVFADWKRENDTGVVYYLRDGRVRGAMMCNVWDQVPAARELILKDAAIAPGDLRGAIG